MKNAKLKTNLQGRRKRQYEFAATILLMGITGLFMLALSILIVNTIKPFF